MQLSLKHRSRPMRAVSTTAIATWNIVAFIWLHPANKHRRLRTICRAALYQARARVLHQRTLATIGECSKIWVDLHRTGASRVLYANPPDYPEMLVWRDRIRPGCLFIDVGANVGSYTIFAAERGAEVIALEPADDTFAMLKENVDLNGYHATLIRAAAGAASGITRFTRGLDSANRVHPEGAVKIDVVTIDSLIGRRRVAGMKVDVEGFELDVLRGAERALSEQRIELIQMEWNTTSLVAHGTDRRPAAELLAKYGYQLYRPDHAGVLKRLNDASFGPDVFAAPGYVT